MPRVVVVLDPVPTAVKYPWNLAAEFALPVVGVLTLPADDLLDLGEVLEEDRLGLLPVLHFAP